LDTNKNVVKCKQRRHCSGCSKKPAVKTCLSDFLRRMKHPMICAVVSKSKDFFLTLADLFAPEKISTPARAA